MSAGNDLRSFRRVAAVPAPDADQATAASEPSPAAPLAAATRGLGAALQVAPPPAPSVTAPPATDGVEAAAGERTRPRRVAARLSSALHGQVKAAGERRNLYLDQLLGEALTRAGEAAVAALLVQPDADRRRKGMRTEATAFYLRPAEQERLDALTAQLPGVSQSRIISTVLELYLQQAGDATTAAPATRR